MSVMVTLERWYGAITLYVVDSARYNPESQILCGGAVSLVFEVQFMCAEVEEMSPGAGRRRPLLVA